MNTGLQSVLRVFQGALKALRTFPAVIGCAFAFAMVTMIRIEMDWPQQESFNFVFNCLHWSFALGAIFSLAAITAAQSRHPSPKAFLSANLIGVMATAITFLLLHFFAGVDILGSRYSMVSALAAARVSVAILISIIAFILLAAYPKDQSDFSAAFFMLQKAFFIALIYGIVIMIGVSGVARAVQALLYHGMSAKVYQYISTLVGFVAFTILIGYFPDFRMGSKDKHREMAQKRPRFIEILFVNILIPIVLALTAVLLIWAGKTVLSGVQVSFLQLSGIAASYTICGLWLHSMVSGYESGLAKMYRRVYPLASLLILLVEAWALLKQLDNSGLKLTEYIFILIWIVAVVGVGLLLKLKSKAHEKIAILICLLAVISVLPVVGYHALPVTAQVNRLETILVRQGILQDHQLKPVTPEPEQDVRVAITDAVMYLATAKEASLPTWFDPDLEKTEVFKAKLGFEPTWEETEPFNGGTADRYLGTYLSLPSEAINMKGYEWVIHPQGEYEKENRNGIVTIQGNKGTYQVDWTTNQDTGIPSLQISQNDRVILVQDMNDYLDRITGKYPPKPARNDVATLEDMTLQLRSTELDVLLVFNHVEISVDTINDVIRYGLNVDALYIKENP